jgi:hypothetical protein
MKVKNKSTLNTFDIYLVRITADTRDTSDPKVKRREGVLAPFSISQTGLFEIGHNEAAKTAINVKPDIV